MSASPVDGLLVVGALLQYPAVPVRAANGVWLTDHVPPCYLLGWPG
jgi:RNA:NAD 2'-phosphotransferase (TPT1/KptA family)